MEEEKNQTKGSWECYSTQVYYSRGGPGWTVEGQTQGHEALQVWKDITRERDKAIKHCVGNSPYDW